MPLAEQLALDGEGLPAQFQGAFRVAESVGVTCEVIERSRHVGMPLAEQLAPDGQGLLAQFQGVFPVTQLIQRVSQVAL